jgi:hypothetical protein
MCLNVILLLWGLPKQGQDESDETVAALAAVGARGGSISFGTVPISPIEARASPRQTNPETPPVQRSAVPMQPLSLNPGHPPSLSSLFPNT